MRWIPWYVIFRVATRRRQRPQYTSAPGAIATIFGGGVFFLLFGALALLNIETGTTFLAIPFVFLTILSVLWIVASL
jgi:hypothetical protein